ncbi:MAG: hypothetical protein ACOCXR_02140, partial [Phototrophicaceae bacterium]
SSYHFWKSGQNFAFFGALCRKAWGQGVPDPLRVREGSALATRSSDFDAMTLTESPFDISIRVEYALQSVR